MSTNTSPLKLIAESKTDLYRFDCAIEPCEIKRNKTISFLCLNILGFSVLCSKLGVNELESPPDYLEFNIIKGFIALGHSGWRDSLAIENFYAAKHRTNFSSCFAMRRKMATRITCCRNCGISSSLR